MSPRLEASDVDVPEKESLVVRGLELDNLDWLDIVLPHEEKQLDAHRVPREDGEIHSLLIDSGAQRVGSAGLRLEWSPGRPLPKTALLLGRISDRHGKVSECCLIGRS
jgi:hypothetical protein